jgi:uncharacterized membrane protein (UPF0136 family)
MRSAHIALAIAFAGLGIWSLTQRDYVTGGLQLVFSASWFLIAFFGDRIAAARKRQRARLPTQK